MFSYCFNCISRIISCFVYYCFMLQFYYFNKGFLSYLVIYIIYSVKELNNPMLETCCVLRHLTTFSFFMQNRSASTAAVSSLSYRSGRPDEWWTRWRNSGRGLEIAGRPDERWAIWRSSGRGLEIEEFIKAENSVRSLRKNQNGCRPHIYIPVYALFCLANKLFHTCKILSKFRFY